MGRVLVVVVVLAGLVACDPSHGARAECPATTTRDVRYRAVAGADPDLLSLDLYRPAVCGPVPVLVWVHGGAFQIGDKANQVAAKVAMAAAEGWALASINYRLSPAVRYPAHSQDVAAAVGWLHRHAGERGLDPHRIGLMGHSAGAFLVALAATDGQFLRAAGVPLTDVRCAVALDTRYDVPAEIATGSDEAEAMYLAALGHDPEVWRRASPAHNVDVGSKIPPFFLVTRGMPGRVADTRAFAHQLLRARVGTTVLDASPLGHAEVNAAVGAPGDTVVTPPLREFLRGCL